MHPFLLVTDKCGFLSVDTKLFLYLVSDLQDYKNDMFRLALFQQAEICHRCYNSVTRMLNAVICVSWNKVILINSADGPEVHREISMFIV